VFCVCSNARYFLETATMSRPFFVCVSTFADMAAEQAPFRITAEVEKVIIFNVPRYVENAWDFISGIPIIDLLTFSGEFTGFSGLLTPPPPM